MIVESKIAGTLFTDPERCPKETFKAFGSFISEEEIKAAFDYFQRKGYRRKWDCIRKAQWAIQELSNKERGLLQLHIGSCFVLSVKTASSYGYAYNPPLEIHAWAFSRRQGVVYDLALPGVILSGLSMSDDIGPYLEDVEPVVMAQHVPLLPPWIQYKAFDIYHGHEGLLR